MRTTIAILLALCLVACNAFVSPVAQRSGSKLPMADDDAEIVARRIIVKGDVQGGYYRSCVLNEVRSGGGSAEEVK